MPMHDWTRVEQGIFHGFHGLWIAALNNQLNADLLPPGFYAYPEHHAGRFVAKLIMLHAPGPPNVPPLPSATTGLAVADAPPKVRHRSELSPSARAPRRTLAIRHVSGHRLVAVIEIVSPAIKDRDEHVAELAGKIDGFLSAGIHVLLLDPFPPGSHDPDGIDAVVREAYGSPESRPVLMPDEPLVAVSYCAALPVEAYLEQFAVGMRIPDMPLFFQADRYINAPLEESSMSAFEGVPAIWREAVATASDGR